MTARITFYFDFVSPNGSIAAHGLGDIEAKHARAVDWRPVSLFHVWGTIGHPLSLPNIRFGPRIDADRRGEGRNGSGRLVGSIRSVARRVRFAKATVEPWGDP